MNLCLLTGATGGLGTSLARLLSKQKISLLLTGRDLVKLQILKEELGAEIFACDLRDRRPLLTLIREKKPDLVINNAGYTFYGDCLNHAVAKELDIFEVNAKAVLEITLEAAHAMKDRGGTIMNISSAAAPFSFPGMAVYAAAKAFVANFSRSLNAEMQSQNIHVLTCLPGQLSTPFAERAAGRKVFYQTWCLDPDAVAKAILRQIQSKKKIQIIDWRYKISLTLAQLLPKAWFEKMLDREIKRR